MVVYGESLAKSDFFSTGIPPSTFSVISAPLHRSGGARKRTNKHTYNFCAFLLQICHLKKVLLKLVFIIVIKRNIRTRVVSYFLFSTGYLFFIKMQILLIILDNQKEFF